MTDDRRPVLFSLPLADELGLQERLYEVTETTGVAKVTEAELLAYGADRIEWNEPDARGRYTPTLYRDDKWVAG